MFDFEDQPRGLTALVFRRRNRQKPASSTVKTDGKSARTLHS